MRIFSTQKEDSKRSYIRAAVAVRKRQRVYLLNERDRSLFRIFKNLKSYYYEIKWNANLIQQGNFIDVFVARHVSGTYAHHQEH